MENTDLLSSVKMSPVSATSIVVLRRNEFAVGAAHFRWQDPKQIANISERVREVILSNPFLDEDDPVQLVGLQGDCVIGSAISIPGRMVIEGEPHPVCWGSYLFVDPDARKTMLALKLVKTFQELCPTTAVCGVSQSGHALYSGFGWVDFEMPRHIILRHSRAVLEKKLGRRMSWLLRIPMDLALSAFNWRLLRPKSRRVEWSIHNELPGELARRLSSAPADEKNTFFVRSTEAVRWQLHGCVPRTEGDRNFLVTLYSGGSLAGYAGAKIKYFPVASSQGYRNVRLGSLYDWRIFDRERLTYRDLAVCVSRELMVGGADAVELCASDGEEELALQSMWLPRAGVNHLMWRAAKGSVLDHERFRDRERWSIRPGDADLFI